MTSMIAISLILIGSPMVMQNAHAGMEDCNEGEYLDVDTCVTLTECTENQYESVAATEFTDRECTGLTECTENQYESAAATEFTDRECTAIPTSEIDIRPGSTFNPVNVNSKGKLPVAILGSSVFDVSQIDVATVDFDIFEVNGSTLATKCNTDDVDKDGIEDLVCFFEIQDIEHKCVGDFPVGQIQGELLDGTPFRGFDDLLWVNCKHFDP